MPDSLCTRDIAIALAILLAAACGDDGPGGPVVEATEDGGGTTTEDAAAPDSGATPPADPRAVRFAAIDSPAEGPLQVWGYAVARIDDARAVVFGGTNASGAAGTTLDGTWLFDAATTPPVMTRIDASGPAPRYCGCAAWDPVRERVVMMGGRDLTAPLGVPPETWELDLETARWTRIDVDTPGSVIGCALAYASEPGAMYLFGGAGAGGPSARTYRWDPSAPAWIELAAEGPSARYDAIFTALPGGRRLLVHAGSYGAMGAAFFSDVWIFDAVDESYREIAAEGAAPEGRRTPWLVVDVVDGEARGFWAAMGYDGRMLPLGDAWYFDFEARTWTPLPLEPLPEARGFAPALPGGPSALGTMLGGFGASTAMRDVWQLVRVETEP